MIGPTRFDTRRCMLCKYHSQPMIRSGLNPVYEHYCNHPDVSPKNLDPIGLAEIFQAETGRFIGYEDITPGWCPV